MSEAQRATTIGNDNPWQDAVPHRARPAARRAAVFSALLCLAAGPSAAGSPPPRGQPMAMRTDLDNREKAIHWPSGFEPEKADLFAHNALFIDAPCVTVWRHIVDAAHWPDWYPNARDVTLPRGAPQLAADTVWRWTTFGLSIESRVHEFAPASRLGWYGYAPGRPPAFYHSWYLNPEGSGCRVAMDEVGVGPDATALRLADEGLMRRGHDLWLAGLRWVSEARR